MCVNYSTKINKLIDFSCDALKPMLRNDNLFCYERVQNGTIRGSSLRYTLISLIGICKAKSNGYSINIDTQSIYSTLLRHIDDLEITIGDIGLFLWLDANIGEHNDDLLINKLNRLLSQHPSRFRRLIGMEIGWIIIGLCYKISQNKSGHIFENLLNEAKKGLLEAYIADNYIVRHDGLNSLRSRYPNFATQIYNLMALAVYSKLFNNNEMKALAEKCGNKILSLQLNNGGWPWLFDIKTGRVIERYEIYSVHQDAMAPMAFMELFELTGNPKYVLGVLKGLDWIYGNNELNELMIDEESMIIYRSIRKKRPYDRFSIALNIALSNIIKSSDYFREQFLEINATCRPYHLGWILEAWVGRNQIIAS